MNMSVSFPRSSFLRLWPSVNIRSEPSAQKDAYLPSVLGLPVWRCIVLSLPSDLLTMVSQVD